MEVKKQISRLAAAALTIAVASCSNDTLVNDPVPTDANVFGNGSKTITLTVKSPDVAMGSRATIPNVISGGSQVDKLFFEIYEADDKSDDFSNIGTWVDSTTYEVTHDFSTDLTLTLSLNEGKQYFMAFWAQNSDCKAYTIDKKDGLKKVTVSYEDAKNNDDSRDAFCGRKSFSGSDTYVETVLHRPFAQINVGTTGADYNNYASGKIYPNKTITKSKIVVRNVCDEIDIFSDKVTASDDELEATFALTTIAETGCYPEYNNEDNPQYLKVKLNDKALKAVRWKLESEEDDDDDVVASADAEEEYETVSVDATTGFFAFKEAYPTIKKGGADTGVETKSGDSDEFAEDEEGTPTYYLTEEFKYLSMCYILAPNTTPQDQNDDLPAGTNKSTYPDDKYNSSLVSVEVHFADDDDETGRKYIELDNVPVHRNWRTNLLGGLADPENPGNPDDNTSLFVNSRICIAICPYYFGEYWGIYDNNNADQTTITWTGNGFSKDGDNDDLHDGQGHETAPAED